MFKLKELRDIKNLTQKDVASILGCGQPNITAIEKHGKDLTKEQLDILIDKFGKDLILSLDEKNDDINDIIDINIRSADKEYLKTIPLLPISAQAGSLNEFLISVKDFECERVITPILGADFAITIAGDSMSPKYPGGSQILIKKIDENAFINWGNTFVLDTCNGVVVKKVYPVDGDDSCIICESINPKYPPFKVYKKDIFGFYRVMMCMSLE